MADTTDFDRTDRPSTAQPPPVHVPGAPSVHDLVIADLAGNGRDVPTVALVDLLLERKAFGLSKYGTILQVEDPARDPAQDLLEELGDALVYAYRARARRVPGANEIYEWLIVSAGHAAHRWYMEPGL